MIIFLIITALTVSIDSLICGFSLSLSSKKKIPVILGIGITVFVMCLFTNYLATLFAQYLSEKTACIGGIILIGIGVYNIIKSKDNTSPKKCGTLSQSLLTGFAVGLDGAAANLSLSIMGINAFYVPVTIAVTHALMIALGIALADTKPAKKVGKIEFLPPAILIILGTYKLLGLFI